MCKSKKDRYSQKKIGSIKYFWIAKWMRDVEWNMNHSTNLHERAFGSWMAEEIFSEGRHMRYHLLIPSFPLIEQNGSEQSCGPQYNKGENGSEQSCVPHYDKDDNGSERPHGPHKNKGRMGVNNHMVITQTEEQNRNERPCSPHQNQESDGNKQ
mgnify:CR=1 FL=1